MTGPELAAIRSRLGLTAEAFATALGYSGAGRTRSTHVYKLERDGSRITEPVARLALMYDRHGVPEGWTTSNAT